MVNRKFINNNVKKVTFEEIMNNSEKLYIINDIVVVLDSELNRIFKILFEN